MFSFKAVKDAIAQVSGMLQQLSVGIDAAALVTILAGFLVLASAIATTQPARLYTAAILKVLGATRAQLFAIFAIEYGLIGVICGALAIGLGAAIAWTIAHYVFDLPFDFDARTAALTVVGAGAATLAMGLAGSWGARSPPDRHSNCGINKACKHRWCGQSYAASRAS